MNNANTNTKGITFCSLLALLFIALKLTSVIGWSWIWVLSPIWMPVAVTAIVIIVAIIKR